jgi:hypothetical protein
MREGGVGAGRQVALLNAKIGLNALDKGLNLVQRGVIRGGSVNVSNFGRIPVGVCNMAGGGHVEPLLGLLQMPASTARDFGHLAPSS